MAAYSTTLVKLGVNGIKIGVQGSMTGFSTATSSVTLTCGSLEDIVIWGYNPSGADDITITVSSTGVNAPMASQGRGSLVLTTALASSDYFFVSGLESNWFQTTANTVIVTATTAIAMGAIELSSTRQN